MVEKNESMCESVLSVYKFACTDSETVLLNYKCIPSDSYTAHSDCSDSNVQMIFFCKETEAYGWCTSKPYGDIASAR